MTSVVQSSSSVYSTYISTIDHLPCDIVRSLWVIQACNVAADNDKQKLNALLENAHQNTPDANTSDTTEGRPTAAQCRKLQQSIRHWNDEAVAEAHSLHNQLEAHRAMLSLSVLQLQHAIADNTTTRDPQEQELLREQLIKHYKEKPLVSQVQARQERASKDRNGKRPSPSGIKLVLKLRNPSRPSSWSPVAAARELKENQPRPRGRPRKYPIGTRVNYRAREKVPKAPKEPVYKSEEPVHEPVQAADTEVYCFCKQPSFGNMIACDNEKCPNGEWFHYKCVGLLNRVEALKYTTQKWYCSEECRAVVAAKPKKKKRKW